MSLAFDATYYQAQRPDVYNAFVATAGSTGLTWAEFAAQHYDSFGRFEGTNPTASFSTSYYLETYTDVAAAGVNPFDHFLNFGATEMRVPFSTFPAASFDSATYLAANTDVEAAIAAGTFANAYQHWVLFGQFEGRSGAPTVETPNTGNSFVFTSTVGENLVGTTGDDTFTGILGTDANIQALDTADGLSGNDTLTILLNSNAALDLPTGFSSSNIENVFLQSEQAGGVLQNNGTSTDATAFSGATAVWQVNDFAAAGTIVGSGQTAGFKDGTTVAADGDVTAAAGVTSVSVALDTVGTGSVITISETTAGGVTSATIAGSVGGAGALSADFGGSTTALATANLGLTTSGTVTLTADAAILTTLDMSSSTGNITISTGGTAFTKLATITGGSGNDVISFDQNGTATVDLTVDGGAGNDTLTLLDSATPTKLLTMTGGAGNDTFDFDDLINVTDEANFADTLITVSDFDASTDVIDVAGVGARDVLTNTELANIAAAASLEAAIDLAGAATSAGEVSVFVYGGNGYMLHSVAGGALADNDGLVQITGLTDVSVLNGTNFISA